ncbi:MAG: ABC transporter substrate-binding protein [Actinobacteria bacterium]|nr:ABC transporter substrate-binding protein [Actinomycetota bacterium]
MAALTTLALLAVACGGDDTTDDDGTAVPTETDGATTGDDGDATTGADSGNGIVIAIGSEPTSLDPQLRDDGGERAVNDNVYETLIARTPEGELTPGLAAEMPTQVDETTWEFTVREGVTFHNGEPFNAESVAFSVNRIIDPEFNSEQISFFNTITGAEAVDDTTVRITTDGPDPVLPSRMYWMKMVEPVSAEDAGFAENPVGTGPYRFTSWNRGESLQLEANPDYWDGAPAIGSVTYRFVPEAGTRLSGLSAGEFDLMTNLLPEDTERAPNFASVQGLEHPHFILNTMEGVTADPRVRQAINLAVDKEAIANDLFQGFAVVDQCQISSPSWFGFNPDLEAYPYDPERAEELIAEAGAEGETIEIVSESGRWLKDRELTETVAAYLEAVGFTTDVQIFEFDEYLNRLFGDVRPPAIFISHSNELQDADRTASFELEIGGTATSHDDDEIHQWVTDARTETDVDAREELYRNAWQKACDEAFMLFLINNEDIYGLSERLEWEPRVDAKLLVKEMSLAG